MPVVQRIKQRLLVYRILRDKTPTIKWVIVLKPPRGKHTRYFTYCQRTVWRWTKTKSRATTFRTYDRALQAARSCSLEWEAPYTIRQL